MRLSELTPAQIRTYFEARLPEMPRNATGEVSMRCPFHDDSRASFGIDLERGMWKCHAENIGGGVLEFEKKAGNCDTGAALANIVNVLGLPVDSNTARIAATYKYNDEDGVLAFEVIKKVFSDGKKTFLQRHRDPDTGDWLWTTKGIRRVLYNLRDVIGAHEVFIVEGEKCADALQKLVGNKIAVTCNPGGAGKWLDEYSPYLTGKKVVILPDYDEPGMKHAQRIAASIYPFTQRVKIVPLYDGPLPEAHGLDIADFLEEGGTLIDLLGLMSKSSTYRPPEVDARMFLPASQFESMVSEEIDWVMEGVIERGANGFICADPKAGKSFAIIDLCLALATGMPFLGFNIPKRTKVAYVSREDNPAMTSRRIRKLRRGRAMHKEELDGWFYLNSRAQTKTLMLDNDEERAELIANLKKLETEIVFLDVFNKLHTADENDNTEMRRVMNHVEHIQREAGCAVFIVHHWRKGAAHERLTQRLRGASSIAGFAECVIGITPDSAKKVRMMEFDIKAGESPEPVYYRMEDRDEGRESVLRVVDESEFKDIAAHVAAAAASVGARPYIGLR